MNNSQPDWTRQRSSLEATEECLARIDKYNETLHAVITPMHTEALESARRADAASARGEWLGVLHGMPVSVKDNFDTAGVRTTMGSDFYRDHIPSRDAFVVARLKEAGAVIVAKENLHEFGFGATTQNPHFGLCKNAWDPTRIPGGSSGGSGVAVASGMSVGALGSDAGGSVRIPAALNGVSGLRPTFGRLSNRRTESQGVPDFSTGGPLARSVVDLARLFVAMDHYDPEDVTGKNGDRGGILGSLKAGVEGMRIGMPRNFFFEDIDSDIEAAVRSAVGVLEGLGAVVVEIDIPGAEEAQSQMTTMLTAQFAALHDERMDEEPGRFGEDVLRRLRMGKQVTGVDYAKSVMWRQSWLKTLETVFSQVDLFASPTVPEATPKVADAEMIETTKRVTRLTYAQPMGDLPALSVPCGFATDGMPIGFQLSGARWQESKLLQAGAAYQAETDWHTRQPKLEE